MLKVNFYGGPYAERKRAIIAPSYYEAQVEDFELSLLRIDYPEKLF